MTDCSIFDKHDNSTMTRSLVTRNMATSIEINDGHLLEQNQKDKPALKVGFFLIPLFSRSKRCNAIRTPIKF